MRSHLVAALFAVALAMTACGASESTADTSAVFGDADVAFAQGMVPHHEQAVEMADLALDPSAAAGDEVTALAERVKAAQQPEIDLMTQWLDDWDEPLAAGDHDGHDMESMDGMMSDDEMEALASAEGDEFDTMWLELMIRHHEGALAMAETALDDAESPATLDLAEAVITSQQAEIDEMSALLAG